VDKVLMLQEGAVAAFGPRDQVLAALQGKQPVPPQGRPAATGAQPAAAAVRRLAPAAPGPAMPPPGTAKAS
jgi:hypothetical protein